MSVAGVVMMVVVVACASFILSYVWRVAGQLGRLLAQAPSPGGLELDSDLADGETIDGPDAVVYDLSERSLEAEAPSSVELEPAEEQAA